MGKATKPKEPCSICNQNGHTAQQCPEFTFDESDDNGDPEITGFECLGCGHVQDNDGECDCCSSYALDAMYF